MIIYECMNDNCKCRFKVRDMDGLRCPKCGSTLRPIPVDKFKGDLSKIPTYKETKLMNLKTAYIWIDEIEDKMKDNLVDEEINALNMCKLAIRERITGYADERVC
mgnify:CR=1 FL=1